MKKKITYICLLIGGFAFAQIEQGEATINRGEDFEQESVTVERIYEPKVEAAEKIKQTPVIAPSTDEKLPVSYATKDIEAASDFETSTINAEELPVDDQNPYNNYIRGAYGNRASLLVDGYGEYSLENNNSIGGSLTYRATNGDIPDTYTDTDDAKFQAEAFYKMNFDNAMADVRLGGSLHNLNLYGLNNYVPYNNIGSVSQRYDNIYAQGKYKAFNHLFLDEVKIKAGFFSDQHDANESNFDLNASFQNDEVFSLDLAGGMDFGASADANINYSNTKYDFENNHKYNFFTIGIAPKLHFKNDLLAIQAGVNMQYNSQSETNDLLVAVENDDTKFHIFPDAQVFVTAVPEFGIYGGITGGLIQNRHQSLVNVNPYLFADQNLITTVNKIEFFAGIRGDIGQNFKYDAKARFQDLENVQLFEKGLTGGSEPFQYNNAFRAVYDDGKRTSVEGVINYLGVQNLNLGASLLFQNYDMDNLEEAYDKPSIQATVSADYKFLDDRLIVGGDLFIVEQRKAFITFVTTGGSSLDPIDLDAYVDLNANATYLITDRWSAFVEINNILNDNYERYLDYEVQGITALGGVMFKF